MVLLSLAIGAMPAGTRAQPQMGPRLFDSDRLDVRPPTIGPTRAAPVPAAPGAADAAPDAPIGPFTRAEITGTTVLDAPTLQRVIAPYLNRVLTREETRTLSREVGALIQARGLAIFGVVIPPQTENDGVLRLRAVEGLVAEIVIQGDTEGADLHLIRSYAERLAAERPLSTATLERYVLLMNDIPGRRVTPALEPLDGRPGQMRLRLTVARINVRIGFGLDNVGAFDFGRLQGFTSLGLDSLLQEGDSTRIGIGWPFDFRRFIYLVGSHRLPIGTNGAALSLSASYLQSYASTRSASSGDAATASLQFTYPIIRTALQNLTFSAGLDVLDTSQLVIGLTAADEATRVGRLGLTYTLTDGTTRAFVAGAVLSQGFDVAGARQGLPMFYGSPDFTKGSFNLGYNHALFGGLMVLRLRGLAQAAFDRLPSSELFIYGGTQIGHAFVPGVLNGDYGFAGVLTLAVPFRFVPEGGRLNTILRQSEAFAYVDGARVFSFSPAPMPGWNRAASAGFGVNMRLATDVYLQLEAARGIVAPLGPDTDDGWRFLFTLRRQI